MISRALFGKKYLKIEERRLEIRISDENHVIVKIHACGVCGTDINYVRDWLDDPMPLGHEVAAEVVETGSNVTTVKPGDRVIVEDCSMCGVCEACKSGHPEFCRNMFTMDGQPGMGEYMSVRYNSLNKFNGLDFTSACLTEPLAVSLTSVLQAEIPLGGSVAVLGNGPLGLMAACLAKLRGAGFVAITGLGDGKPISRARFDAAEALGCDLIIQAGKQSVEDEIKKKFTNGVDRVIVSSPPQSLSDALKIIRFGGIIVFFGLHFGGKNKIEVDVNDLVFRKITLRPTFAEPAINFPISNRLLKDGLVDAGKLITHTFGFDQVKTVMGAIVEGNQPIVKAVMLPYG
ncbi:MAG: alcohol dehydrogenase catalytic domain-containing protein [Verrucomicrobia bacterium]|nr:alcohol dehydrogenase catalytic domain-containing protein [Verrucomicrobiota bacterium]MCG2679242.1 alcohol dehydrogenase catalytic domain-containing protein [Kiritimatiellia bacterium]MBU4248636.1 alcohol dehydrogenase catalytic domain-containing protein [Verrucomicrobiota bacterium]MBU4290097.1 alcohol dehydrogenase catalytic domain-containing protein [Verrucomicrobiota bacterium]MBU4429795.1 alcohol dehydrogenase catalytic domain-containing protein [Verrucomicrobiota bacterium]